jgi:hypothetical protein
VQEGEDIECLGRTNNAYTVAHVEEDGDGSSAEAAAAVAATVAAACMPKPGTGIQHGTPLLISHAFTGAGKVYGMHVHVKHI